MKIVGRLPPPRDAGDLDPSADPAPEVARRGDVPQAGHDPALLGEGGEGVAALVAGVEVRVEAPALVGVRSPWSEALISSSNGSWRFIAHRAKPSAASARRISPRARHRSVRDAAVGQAHDLTDLLRAHVLEVAEQEALPMVGTQPHQRALHALIERGGHDLRLGSGSRVGAVRECRLVVAHGG